MLWLVPTILTAVTMGTEDALVKRFFQHLPPRRMALYPLAYCLPLFLIALPFVPWPARVGPTFIWSTVAVIILSGVTYFSYYKAIKVSPLSLTVPFLSFVPVFASLSGYLFLGEIPTWGGAAGIGLVVVGCYLLNLDRLQGGSVWAPFTAVLREPGSRLVLLISTIWGLAAVLGKVALVETSPLFYGVFLYSVFNTLMILTVIVIDGPRVLTSLRLMPLKGAIVGGLFFLHALTHFWAIALTQAAYMLAVKRFNVIVAVILGWLFFKEGHIGQHLVAVIIMFAGVVLIAWLG